MDGTAPRLGLTMMSGLPFAALTISSKISISMPPITEREGKRRRRVGEREKSQSIDGEGRWGEGGVREG
jgi:hypothetical protein